MRYLNHCNYFPLLYTNGHHTGILFFGLNFNLCVLNTISFSICLPNFNWTIDGVVMALYRTSKMAAKMRISTSGFRWSDYTRLWRLESFSRQNFDRQLTDRQLYVVKPRVMLSRYPLLLQLQHQQLFCLRRDPLQLIDVASWQ